MKTQQFSLDDSPGFLISQVAGRLQRNIDRTLASEGITGAQWTVLWLLAAGRAQTPIDISHRLSMDTGAITRLLDRMVAKNLLVRRPHATDRRSVILELTPQAQALYPTLPSKVAQVVMDAFKGISQEELIPFKQVLLQVLKNIDMDQKEP